MWIRRTDSEIEQFEERQARKRRSLLRPAAYALLWSSVLMLGYYLGFRGGTRGAYIFAPPGGASTTVMIKLSVLCFAIIATVIYRKQRRGKKMFDAITDTHLCNGCWEPASGTPGEVCACGGQLEPYDHYRWQEDKVSEVTV